MKTFFCLLQAALCSLFLFSCKKDNVQQEITGKWQMQEKLSNYANGGNPTWYVVPDDYQYSVEFHEDGTFIQTSPLGTTPGICTGTYIRLNDHQIRVKTDCKQGYSVMHIRVNNKGMVLSYRVREGEISEKFLKVQ